MVKHSFHTFFGNLAVHRNAVTLASAVNACDKGAQWGKALDLLREVSGRTMGEVVLAP